MHLCCHFEQLKNNFNQIIECLRCVDRFVVRNYELIPCFEILRISCAKLISKALISNYVNNRKNVSSLLVKMLVFTSSSSTSSSSSSKSSSSSSLSSSLSRLSSCSYYVNLNGIDWNIVALESPQKCSRFRSKTHGCAISTACKHWNKIMKPVIT